jgi:hypothetical protein
MENDDPGLQNRIHNREELSKELLSGTQEARTMVEALGISHLNPAEQGVALAALAKEKMSFYSNEYNMVDARTLADMGHGLALEVGEQWAIRITALRLATFYLRIGHPMLAIELLHDTTPPSDTIVSKLRHLEERATLALAHRLSGNATLASKVVTQCITDLHEVESELTKAITTYLQQHERKSEYIGMKERVTSFPRIDYIASILSLLTQEAIARGSEGDKQLNHHVVDHMLAFNTTTKQLALITPQDDPGFFAAYLREYIQLFNGLCWYAEPLQDNIKYQSLIEETFQQLQEWMKILPPYFWLGLRPARFLEAFFRAESWSEMIRSTGTKSIIDRLLHEAGDLHLPNFHYIFAEAFAHSGRYDDAVQQLEELLSNKYEKGRDPSLESHAKQLLTTIELERIGILLGVSKESTWWTHPITIQLEEIRIPVEPTLYLQELHKKPILRLIVDFDPHLQDYGIALFGDKLVEQWQGFQSTIISVGKREYSNVKWSTPVRRGGMTVEGIRMDVLIIRTKLEGMSLTLVFEGKAQEVVQEENHFRIAPSSLLLLRGAVFPEKLDPNTLLNFLTGLMTMDPAIREVTTIYVLKDSE